MTEIHRTVKFTAQKERRWHRNAIDRYDKHFMVRWLRDPSAKATRNIHRQVLDPATEQPYIKTLLRCGFARRDEDPNDLLDDEKKIPREVDFVGMNRHLQLQPRMSLHEKRRYAMERIKDHHMQHVVAAGRRAAG